MATIKSYTDIEQSKKLTKILTLESADCFWDYDELQKYYSISWFEEGYEKDSQLRLNKNNVCAWSLAALLNVLPEPELIQNSDKRWMLRIWDKNRFPWSIGGYDNPIDACYELILKLHERKML